MDPIEGLYIVALASVFSMIPSGPAYAGTQDAAAILGIKALGGTGAQAVAYIVMLRFIIVVPITARRPRAARRPLRRARPAADDRRAGERLSAMQAATLPQPASAPAAVRRPRGELIAYGVLVLIALGLRFYQLGDRPFHHDESQDAYFSWIFWKNGDYAYDPLLHGPLRFYLTAAMYTLFGDSDFTARLAPALMGTLMVPLPYLLRRQLGRVAAFTAAVFLAAGPSYLYFSRFAREDIYMASITLAMLVVVFRFLDRPRRHHPALIGALLALSFATKETTFITVFVAGTFFIAVLATWHRHLLIEPVRAVGLDRWGWALAAFVGVFTVLFTTFLTHPGGLWDGIYTGLKYWLSQHGVRRGGESKVVLRRAAVRRRVAGAAARDGRRGRRAAAPDAAARVPRVGVPACR